MTVNSILVRRYNKFLLPPGARTRIVKPLVDDAVAATFNLNLQSLGYTLSPEALKELSSLTVSECTKLFKEITDTLKKVKGVTRYAPMYPNFPEQVINASDAELYLNAIIHYFTVAVSDVTGLDCIWLPKYKKNKRDPLDEQVSLTVLRTTSAQELYPLVARIVTSNTSLSHSDKDDLRWFIDNGYLESIPETIPNKENLAVVGSMLLGKVTSIPDLSRHMKTATDVLRLAVAASNEYKGQTSDVSLAEPCLFRNFKRSERRILLSFLDRMNPDLCLEDMHRWHNRWLRLGERLHPGEYLTRFPNAANVFAKLRTEEIPPTFNSHVETFVRSGNTLEAVNLLQNRPGELARRLDHLYRQGTLDDSIKILDVLERVSEKISTPVLLQVMKHFSGRNSTSARVIFPKGSQAKLHALTPHTTTIDPMLCSKTEEICANALKDRFCVLPTLGKVYVDPELSDFLVPFSQRSASSKGGRQLVRGSKLKFSTENDTLRFFIFWKNNPERVDLDLSAILYDEKWEYIEHVSYTNLRSGRNKKYSAVHSGDITDAPNGAAEYIDVSISDVIEYGARYVSMVVNSFTHQKFSELGNVYAGWMLRESPQSGEIFDPRTVVDKIDVTAESTIVIPMFFDLVDRKMIWVDMNCPRNLYRANNIESAYETITTICEAYLQINKPTLYDLFTLHGQSRGILVDNPVEADVVFSVESDIPLEEITTEYLTDKNYVAVSATK